jgi:alanine dehydrogenase
MSKTLGVLAEVKDGERRIALDPYAVAMLTGAGLKVLVEQGAGVAAGFADTEYRAAGADLISDVAVIWGADLVVKVKEPLPSEWRYFRPGLKIFGYLHLAAAPESTHALQDAGVEAHAFETVSEGRGRPLRAPMSDIAVARRRSWGPTTWRKAPERCSVGVPACPRLASW